MTIGGRIEGKGQRNLVRVVRWEELEKFGWESGIWMALVATGMKIKRRWSGRYRRGARDFGRGMSF